MRLRRTNDEATGVAPEDAELLVLLAVALDGSLGLLRHLLDRREEGPLDGERREEALGGARRLAEASRLCFMRVEELDRGLPEPLSHHAALRVAGRVTYALVALAREEPEELALLSREETDRLLPDNGIEDWLDHWLAEVPKEARG